MSEKDIIDAQLRAIHRRTCEERDQALELLAVEQRERAAAEKRVDAERLKREQECAAYGAELKQLRLDCVALKKRQVDLEIERERLKDKLAGVLDGIKEASQSPVDASQLNAAVDRAELAEERLGDALELLGEAVRREQRTKRGEWLRATATLLGAWRQSKSDLEGSDPAYVSFVVRNGEGFYKGPDLGDAETNCIEHAKLYPTRERAEVQARRLNTFDKYRGCSGGWEAVSVEEASCSHDGSEEDEEGDA